jgi:hypothetical protein
MTNDFLPKDYEPPKGESRYMRFEEGANKFRMLSKPIIGWEDWKDKKPLRYKIDNKPDYPINPGKPIKHFWAMIVWNYQTERIEILEITQISIQQVITSLSRDPEWGVPFKYDIKVERQGTGMDTKYTILGMPPSKVIEEVKQAYKDTPINLDALYDGEDPFDTKIENEPETIEDHSDLPF